jgi:hypothetical protein
MARETNKVDMSMERHELKIMASPHHDPEDQAKQQPQRADDNIRRVDGFHSLSPPTKYL